MLWILFVIFGMIAANALYVSAEFAVVSCRRGAMHHLASIGNKRAQALLPILEDGKKLDRYVATSQIGITLTSIILGAFGQGSLSLKITPFVEAWFNLSKEAAFSLTAIVVLATLTTLQMVLGELVPKSISLLFPNKMAMLTYLPMQWSMAVFSWFIAILNGSGNAILKLFGSEHSFHRHIHSPEEIEMLIAESRDGGILEPDEHARLKKALALGARKASEILIPRNRIVAINADASTSQLIDIVANSPYTRFPVYSGTTDNVIGMIHVKDVATNYIKGGEMPPIKDMLKPLPAIPATVTADRLLSILRKRKAHLAVVIDEFGSIDGIVTLEDILSEVVGSVGDEFKRGDPSPEHLPDGRVRLPGLLRLDEAEPWIRVRWKGDAYTVAGRVMEALGTIPVPGDTTVIDGVAVEVERVHHKAIVTVLARPLRP